MKTNAMIISALITAAQLIACSGSTTGGQGPAIAESSRAPTVAPADGGTAAGARLRSVDAIAISGKDFFPEGIASFDGTLFVGSLITGEIVRVPPGKAEPEPFVAPGALGTVGLLVDSASHTLWACKTDFAHRATPGGVVGYDIATGAEKRSFALPASSLCNDLAFDAQGNLYVTDTSAARIHRLQAGGDHLEVWAEDPLFKTAPGQFGVNGVAWLDGGLIVAKSATGQLLRITVNPDGSKGSISALKLDGSIGSPDGIKALGKDRLLIVDNKANALHAAAVHGEEATVATIATGFDFPTTAAVEQGGAWVVEGQLNRLLEKPPRAASLPFHVRRVALP